MMEQQPFISCKRIVKAYWVAKHEIVALRGIDFEMQRGELVIQTGEATYLPKEQVLLAPGDVVIIEPGLKVEGSDVKVELAAKKVIIAQHHLTEIKVRDWRVKQ